MTLTVDLTPEEEARLAVTAKARGVSVGTLVNIVLKEVAAQASRAMEATASPTLPRWPGNVIGGLRREDIYEDVR